MLWRKHLHDRHRSLARQRPAVCWRHTFSVSRLSWTSAKVENTRCSVVRAMWEGMVIAQTVRSVLFHFVVMDTLMLLPWCSTQNPDVPRHVIVQQNKRIIFPPYHYHHTGVIVATEFINLVISINEDLCFTLHTDNLLGFLHCVFSHFVPWNSWFLPPSWLSQTTEILNVWALHVCWTLSTTELWASPHPVKHSLFIVFATLTIVTRLQTFI